MKIEINSVWDRSRKCPNVWFTLRAEDGAEKALIHSLYSVKGSTVVITDGYMMVNFYPKGADKK